MMKTRRTQDCAITSMSLRGGPSSKLFRTILPFFLTSLRVSKIEDTHMHPTILLGPSRVDNGSARLSKLVFFI
jgi:hypothetical protein